MACGGVADHRVAHLKAAGIDGGGLSRRRFCLAAASLSALAALGPRAWAQESGPAAPIARLDAALLDAMRQGSSVPFAQRAAALRAVVEQVFDLQAILRASVGPLYASLPEQQKADLLEAFTAYTVATYAANFDSYDGQRFVIAPDTRAVAGDVVVRTDIVPTSGAPTRLDYVMRQTGAGWRAVDVLVDGTISRAAVQRSDFRSLLRGGSAEALIRSLRAKAARLASG